MKRYLLVLAIAVMGCSVAKAQESTPARQESEPARQESSVLQKSSGEQRWSAAFSMGSMIYQYLFYYGLSTGQPDVIPGGTQHRDAYELPLYLSADIYRSFSKSFAVGLRSTISYNQLHCYDKQGQLLGKVVSLPATLSLVGKFTYYKGKEFELYGIYGLGLASRINLVDFYWKQTPSLGIFTTYAELYPVGMRWGRKQGFFAELGSGSKGLVSLGYFTNF